MNQNNPESEASGNKPYSSKYSFRSGAVGPTVLERYQRLKLRKQEQIESLKERIPANLRYYRLGTLPKLALVGSLSFYLVVRILRNLRW